MPLPACPMGQRQYRLMAPIAPEALAPFRGQRAEVVLHTGETLRVRLGDVSPTSVMVQELNLGWTPLHRAVPRPVPLANVAQVWVLEPNTR